MKSQYKQLVLVVMATTLLNGCNEQVGPVVSGPYLGQEPPGLTPEVFAPGLVSTGHQERNIAFSPDGRELYYCLYGAPHSVFLVMQEVNGRWTRPRVAPFSGRYPGELAMSPNGNTMVFSSNQPFEGSLDSTGYWIWKVDRDGPGWGQPKPLSGTVNSGRFAGYPSISGNGNLYFFSERVDGKGADDIYTSEWVDGHYTESQNLGDSVNSHLKEVDPFIAPDESFLIFCRREEDTGWDLFISFRREDRSWTTAMNMGPRINSDASDFCPSLSPDGKYLFFTSTRSHHRSFSEVPLTYEDKIRILNSPGNGNSDIYWVDAKIIQELRSSLMRH
jgi:Tol biopolymer transport system component